MTATRTALYYPNIAITNKGWLRQTLLFWDEIGSIVPKEVWEDHPYFEIEDEEINQLYSEGIYRPFFPDDLRMKGGHHLQEKFNSEFFTRLNYYDKKLDLSKRGSYVPVYKSKEMHMNIFHKLERRNLATEKLAMKKIGASVSIYERNNPVIFIEKNAADLYMSLLAEYLANNDSKITIPLTDQGTCLDATFEAIDECNQQTCAKIMFKNILPVPKSDVSVHEIIRFKKEHEGDLIEFRQYMDGLGVEAISCRTASEIRDFSIRKSEEIKKEVTTLKKSLKEFDIDTVFGSLHTIVDVKRPDWWQALVSSGIVSAGTEAFPLTVIGGLAVNAAINVGRYISKRNIERNDMLRDSPYTYLYQMKRRGIVP